MAEFGDDPPIPSWKMVLDYSVILDNIDRSEVVNIVLPSDRAKARPFPSTNVGFETTISFTALNVCDRQEFRDLYNSKLGKSISLAFEGKVYFGYLSNVVHTEHDIQFDFTYTSRVEQVEEIFQGPPTR